MEVWRGITEGLNAVIVNPSVILGPGNWQTGSPSFFRLVDNGFKYYTEGVTGYVDVRDLAEIMVQLMESDIIGERFTISAENISYKQFLTGIANALGKPAPHQSISRRQADLFSAFEAVLAALFGKEPRMTKETVHIAFAKSYYGNDKLKKVFPYTYKSIEQSIKDIALIYKENTN
jgi:nucleoside-diphosphate-sugar epimerase